MRRLTLAALLLLSMVSAHLEAQTNARDEFRSRCGAGVHPDEGVGVVPLPQGNLFCPLVADPKAGQAFASYVRGDFATLANAPPGTDTNIAAVGIAYGFGLIRFAGPTAGNGLQLDVVGAVFAQFNLDEPSFDLINADYLIGMPTTLRMGGSTARLRVYHQSSHLGDEYLLAGNPERINVSFESLEMIVSQELGSWRVYGGGETFFRRRPTDLAARLAHFGIEIRPATFGAGRLLAALDFKVVDDGDWSTALSARAGVEIARVQSVGHPARVLSVLAQFYDGVAPYGQFYRDNIRFYGIGLNFSL